VPQLTLMRGNGGFGAGASAGAPPAPHPIPERKPDAVCDLATLPQAALIYRLSGDLNPLHMDRVVTLTGLYKRKRFRDKETGNRFLNELAARIGIGRRALRRALEVVAGK